MTVKSNVRREDGKKPSIDVIVNFVDEYEYVKHAISSVHKSHNVDMRIILQDDSGQDNSRFFSQYLRNHDLYSQSNRLGYIGALKAASEKKSSEFIGILNADDITNSKRFYRQIIDLSAGDIDISIGSIKKFKLWQFIRVPSMANSWAIADYCPHLLWLGPFGADATWVVRSETLNLILDDDISNETDWYLALTKFFDFKVKLQKQAKYLYRQHSKQLTRKKMSNYTDELEVICSQLRLNLDLNYTPSQMLPFSTPWLIYDNLDLQRVLKQAKEIINRHNSICSNQNAFQRQTSRRVLIQIMTLPIRTRIQFLLKHLALESRESFQFLIQLVISVVLQSTRTNR
jgi:hypothetical protein